MRLVLSSSKGKKISALVTVWQILGQFLAKDLHFIGFCYGFKIREFFLKMIQLWKNFKSKKALLLPEKKQAPWSQCLSCLVAIQPEKSSNQKKLVPGNFPSNSKIIVQHEIFTERFCSKLKKRLENLRSQISPYSVYLAFQNQFLKIRAFEYQHNKVYSRINLAQVVKYFNKIF